MMKTFIPGLIIKDLDGIPLAVVEARSRYHFSEDVAIEIRRNMLIRGLPAQIPYFLMISQDEALACEATEPGQCARS